MKPSNGLIKKRKQHPNREIFMIIQVIFKWYSLKQAKIKKKKQANPNKIVYLIINNSQFIWVKAWYSYWHSLSSPSYYNWTS